MNAPQNYDPVKIVRWALLALLLILPPLIFENRGYYLRISTLVSMFAGLGGAWNIIGGFANQVSLGHAGFFGVGVYTSTLLLKYTGLSPWLGMIAAGGLAGILSLVIAVPTFRLRGHYFALGTIAFAEILRVLLLVFQGNHRGTCRPLSSFCGTLDLVFPVQWQCRILFYCSGLALPDFFHRLPGQNRSAGVPTESAQQQPRGSRGGWC